MTKRQKFWTATVITIILLILFLVYYFKSRKQGEKCPDGRSIPLSGNCSDNPVLVDSSGNTIVTPVTPDLNGCTPPSNYITNAFSVGLGMKGSLVEQIQIALNQDFGSNLKVDGYFGCNTLKEVKKAYGVDAIDAELFKDKIQKSIPIQG